MTDALKYIVDAIRRAPDEVILDLVRSSLAASSGPEAGSGRGARADGPSRGGRPGGVLVFSDDEYALSYEPPGGAAQPLKVATSNRLLRALARARLEDEASRDARKGWRTNDELCVTFGVNLEYLNVIVYRARTSLRNAGAGEVIERNPRTHSVRLTVEPNRLRGLDDDR